MICYQATVEYGQKTFPTLREAKQFVKNDGGAGTVYRINVDVTAKNMMRAIDGGGYANDYDLVWEV